MPERSRGASTSAWGAEATIRQYPSEGLVDELQLAVAPVLLGAGEPLFSGLDLRALGYACVRHVASRRAAHAILEKTARP